MNADQLVDMVTVVLAVSVASERLVTAMKTAFPALADELRTPTLGEDRVADRPRRLLVMAVALLSAYVTSGLIAGSFGPLGHMSFGPTGNQVAMPIILVALLASGGSAFWGNLLGYTKSVKDAQAQNTQMGLSQLREQAMKSGGPMPDGMRTSALRDDHPAVTASLNRLRNSPDPAL